jgi:hypothetical protein
MDPFGPIQPIQPGLPGRVQRVDRDQQRERARDPQQSPSDEPDEQAFEEEFSEAYEQRRQDLNRAKPGPYWTPPLPEPESNWDPRLRRDRRNAQNDDDDPEADEPGPHIDIIA